GIGRGTFLYWRPASEYALFLPGNRKATDWLNRLYELLLGQIRHSFDFSDFAFPKHPESFPYVAGLLRVAWGVVIAYVLAFVLAIRVLLQFRRRRDTVDRTLVAFAALLIATVGYLTI